MSKLTAIDVAKYFLTLQDEEAGDLISHLKLQKLVYYAQGFYLALYHKPLFDETIEAWNHGPVIPSLYQTFKPYGNQPIPMPDKVDFSKYDEEIRGLLDEVYSVFGQFSAWKLRKLTHNEPTWKEAFKGIGIISTNSMEEYFQTLLNNEN